MFFYIPTNPFLSHKTNVFLQYNFQAYSALHEGENGGGGETHKRFFEARD